MTTELKPKPDIWFHLASYTVAFSLLASHFAH